MPWPGFYINEILNDNIKILGYFYSDKYIFCNVWDNEEVVIPYNEHYFAYENKKLILKNKLLINQSNKSFDALSSEIYSGCH